MASPTGVAGGSLSGNYPNPGIKTGAVGSAQVASSIKDAAATVASLRTLGRNANQACAGNDARLSNARTPAGTAGGDLQGAYPNPQIRDGSITPTKLAAVYVDGPTHSPSLRTLGIGAQQAVAGNDVRLSNSRSPSGPALGDLGGNYPFPVISRLQGFELDLTTTSPLANQVIGFNGTKFVPVTVSGGGGGVSVLTGVAPIAASVSAGEGTIELTGIVDASHGGTGLSAPDAGDAGKVVAAKADGTYELITVGGVGSSLQSAYLAGGSITLTSVGGPFSVISSIVSGSPAPNTQITMQGASGSFYGVERSCDLVSFGTPISDLSTSATSAWLTAGEVSVASWLRTLVSSQLVDIETRTGVSGTINIGVTNTTSAITIGKTGTSTVLINGSLSLGTALPVLSGGTGLSNFGASGRILYSTNANVLAAGTLSNLDWSSIRPVTAVNIQAGTDQDLTLKGGDASAGGEGCAVFISAGSSPADGSTPNGVFVSGGKGFGTVQGGVVYIDGGTSESGTFGTLSLGTSAGLFGSPSATSAVTIGRTGITTTIDGTLALANRLTPANGGTGLGAPAAGDVGKVLTAKADGTYELATSSSSIPAGEVPAVGGPYGAIPARTLVTLSGGVLAVVGNNSLTARVFGFYTGSASNTLRTSGRMTGFSGLTPDADYYLGAAGAITTTRTTTSGTTLQYVGRAISSTELFVLIGEPFGIS